MSRRTGQNPEVREGKRKDGTKYFFFQYWIDIPGLEARVRKTEVIGPVKTPKAKTGKDGTVVNGFTKSEAERKKLEFLANLNSSNYQLPSSQTFSDAVKFYREIFAPRMLRASTFDIANGHLKKHLEPDWSDIPVEHITIDSVNEWIWKKRKEKLSWVTIKNILRTMQRVLSASSKDKKPPFSQQGLAIPERDKLKMKIDNRQKVSFSWGQTIQVVEQVQKLDNLRAARKEQYSTLLLTASASGLRCSELLALRVNDIDFSASTIRVDESSDQRTAGKIGPCKNATAYRTVVLHDAEGQSALKALRRYVKTDAASSSLIFHSKANGPLSESMILNQCLHPALDALQFERAGLHAFRAGCNRRWELAGLAPAVIRQQMGHTSAAMTARYTGEIPLDQIKAEFSSKFGTKIDVLENDGKQNSALIAA